MKVRQGFVSNSSSTAFMIVNRTDETLPLSEFIRENEHLITMYTEEWGSDKKDRVPWEQLCRERKIWGHLSTVRPVVYEQSHTGTKYYITCFEDIVVGMCKDSLMWSDLNPGRNCVIFGDEDGTLLGEVYDYALREGGISARFSWGFTKSLH